MANFSSILDMPSSDVKFPKLPVGSYIGVVKGMPRYGKSTKKMTDFVEFQIQLVEAMEDVDPDLLEEFGTLSEKSIPLTFYYADSDGAPLEGGFKRLRAFLDNCGIEGEGTVRQQIEQASGRTIVVEIKHTPSADGQSVYAQIDGTAKYGD
jgi:hypothetical protein